MSFRYMSRRLFRAAVTLWLVVTFVFIILRITGDPADTLLPDDSPPEVVEFYRKAWGLDKPMVEQYALYFKSVFQGDLGRSFRDNREAIEVMVERIPATLRLGCAALGLAIVCGILLGIFAALHRNSLLDRTTMALAVFGYSMPNFFLGILLIFLFAMKLRMLPSAGSETFAHMIMPLVTLSAAHAAGIARFSRSAMLEVLNEPYIRTAKAKGVPYWGRLVRHALPNALIPIITVAGLKVGHLIGGAIIIETVFAWPGVGRLLVMSVATRDLAVVQAIVLMLSCSMIAANLTVDLLYGWVDPRIRVGRTEESR
jgi:peptide/nickel transport system permease protein